ncbi:MAG TPA: hypothetical protein VHA75_00830 [Rugosimonospora sp.]|nr:hypothetical protein [Rugosimonospora sp.]
MRRVTVPPGCTGLDMADGTRYRADRNGQVQVADRHADAIRTGWYGSAGVMAATNTTTLGTARTRWCSCVPGRKAWNAWTYTCPRCGAATTEE